MKMITTVLVLFFVAILSGCTSSELECSGLNSNECNGQCWSNCAVNQIFKCETSGGTCGADPNNCPVDTPNSCNDQCWAKCDANRIFKCDPSIGGTCIADPMVSVGHVDQMKHLYVINL
ncbi:hypothetical protein J4446_01005 [Candidatus Woesearchaeota archaeon]|nr:hypothetical protein [Candidatus Woesearchaeota archaeon]